MRALCLALAALTLASPAAGLDPTKRLGQYAHRSWQLADGLPQNSVTALAQTADGYIWVGTQEGLVRFDGVRMVVEESVVDRTINSLAVDETGTLWVATLSGLSRKVGDHFERHAPADPRLRDAQYLIPSRRGGLYVLTRDAMYRLLGDVVTLIPRPDQTPRSFGQVTYEDEAGTLWVATRKGLYRRDGDRYTAVSLGRDGAPVNSLGGSGRDLLVGTERGEVYLVDQNGPRLLVDGKSDARIPAYLHGDSNGALWLGRFPGGFGRLDEHGYSGLPQLDGTFVGSVLFDRQGNMWLGTFNDGLHVLGDGPFRPIGVPEGLGNEMANAAFEDRDGAIWVATQGGGVSRIDGNEVKTYRAADGLGHDIVRSIYQARDGALWFGHRGGFTRFDHGTFTTQEMPNDVARSAPLAIAEDDRGAMWAQTFNGPILFDGKAWARPPKELALPPDVFHLAGRARGGLWMGARSGEVGQLVGGQYTTVVKPGAGLGQIHAFTEEADGTLWISADGALGRLRGGQLALFGKAQGLYDDRIFNTVPAGSWLFFTSNRGVFRVERKDLEAVASGASAKVVSRVYGTLDGLRSPEANATGAPSAWATRDGRLLFTTIRGLAIYEASRDHGDAELHPPIIESMRSGTERLTLAERSAIPARVDDLELHYSVPFVAGADLVRFRYRLNGEPWIDAGPRRVAFFTNLPPGSYRFQVQAALAGGDWHPATELDFAMEPRLLERTSVRVALALLLAGALALASRWRTRLLEARKAELEKRVTERTAALAAANAELDKKVVALENARAQLVQAEKLAAVGALAAGVGHEINNPLSFIQSNIKFALDELKELRVDTADDARWAEVAEALDEARQGGVRVARIVSDLKTFSRVNPQDEVAKIDLAHTLELSINMSMHQIRHRARMKKQIAAVPAVMGDPTRIGQVFLNLLVNAAQAIPEGQRDRHEVGLEASIDARGWARIDVSDTGSGIPPEVLPRIFEPFFTTKPQGVGTGLGLPICKSIVERMGGELRVETTVGRGTTFTVFLPPAAVAEGDEVAQLDEAKRDGARARLLVVDDEPMVGAALARALKGDHDMVTLTSARTALERLSRGERYDAILCDLMMPEMSGMELYGALEKTSPEIAARFVFLSGGAFTEAARDFLENVEQPCLEKPFDVDVIREQVREILERRESLVAV